MHKICVVSGNRADRAALIPVADALKAQWAYVDTLPSRNSFDSAVSCGQAMMMAAEQLNNIKPDLVILAGDRFEILGAAVAAHLMGIPIAHLSGGDVTEGSQDDAMRHAITKLAALHFPTNWDSANRLIAMGEEKWRIHMVGAPQIDYLLAQELYSREETLERLGFQNVRVAAQEYALVAYQPPTMEVDPAAEIDELLRNLGKDDPDWPTPHYIFTTVNPDAGGVEITRKITKFCSASYDQHRIVNMGSKLFLSAMKHCRYIIGNSSAGFYEAPTLGTRFVNIGDRQNGRSPITGDGKAAERIRVTLNAMMLVPRNVLLQKKWGVQCNMTQLGNAFTRNDHGASTPKKNWSGGPVATNQGGFLTLDQDKDHLLGF